MHIRLLLVKVERFGTTFLTNNLEVFFTNARVQQAANRAPVTIYGVDNRRLAKIGAHNDMIDTIWPHRIKIIGQLGGVVNGPNRTSADKPVRRELDVGAKFN